MKVPFILYQGKMSTGKYRMALVVTSFDGVRYTCFEVNARLLEPGRTIDSVITYFRHVKPQGPYISIGGGSTSGSRKYPMNTIKEITLRELQLLFVSKDILNEVFSEFAS